MKECCVLKAEVKSLEEDFPVAVAIVIAPTIDEAELLIGRELGPYLREYPYRLGYNNLGSIQFCPIPTTIFLYSINDGQIK